MPEHAVSMQRHDAGAGVPARGNGGRAPANGRTNVFLVVVALLCGLSLFEYFRPNPDIVGLVSRSHPGNLRWLVSLNAEGWSDSSGSGWVQTRGYVLLPASFPLGEVFFITAHSDSPPSIASVPLLMWLLLGFLAVLFWGAAKDSLERFRGGWDNDTWHW